MNRKLLYIGLLLMIVVGTASYSVVRWNEPLRRTGPSMIDGFPAWHQNSTLPWKFDPMQESYQGSKLSRSLQFLDREARRLAASDWEKLAGPHYPFTEARGKFNQDYQRTYRAIWDSGEKPTSSLDPLRWQREFQLRLNLSEAQPTLREFSFHCALAKERAWSVTWDCDINQAQPISRIFFLFWQPEIQFSDHGETRPYSFYLGPHTLSLPDINEWTSEEHEAWREFCRTNNSLSERQQPAALLRYWQSPESFEGAAIEELDACDWLIARWFIAAANMRRTAPYQGGGIPPEELPPLQIPLGRRVSMTVFASLVNQAHRQQIQQYASEMHRVLVESFPKMPELLQQLQSPAPP